jgi:hypothetical protein
MDFPDIDSKKENTENCCFPHQGMDKFITNQAEAAPRCIFPWFWFSPEIIIRRVDFHERKHEGKQLRYLSKLQRKLLNYIKLLPSIHVTCKYVLLNPCTQLGLSRNHCNI